MRSPEAEQIYKDAEYLDQLSTELKYKELLLHLIEVLVRNETDKN